jgi:hypothetical protein
METNPESKQEVKRSLDALEIATIFSKLSSPEYNALRLRVAQAFLNAKTKPVPDIEECDSHHAGLSPRVEAS